MYSESEEFSMLPTQTFGEAIPGSNFSEPFTRNKIAVPDSCYNLGYLGNIFFGNMYKVIEVFPFATKKEEKMAPKVLENKFTKFRW